MESKKRMFEQEYRRRMGILFGPLWGGTYRFDDGASDPPSDPPDDPPADPDKTILGDDGKKIIETKPAIVNGDGTFSENWRDLLPEELRQEECWDVVKDFPGMAKQFVNQRKAIGKDKIVVPNEKSTPEEWDAFYNAVGRPQTPDDYKVDVPEDLQEIFSPERLQEAQKLAHSLGVSNKQFSAFMQHEMQAAVKLLEAEEAEELKAKQGAEEVLRKEFGGAYEERLHVANRVVQEAFPKEEQRMAFLEKYGNDPDFIRFASVVGSRMAESKAIVAEMSRDTPKEIDKKVAELQATPGYMAPNGQYVGQDGKQHFLSAEARAEITERIRELHKQKFPSRQEPSFAGLRG